MEVSGASAVLAKPARVAAIEMPVATGFTYQPALDGVRGIAVAMVLLFHARFGWMSGGYLGVSVFFTLSGYLITSLALVEHDETGRLGVRSFYARRIRRLIPASLVCLTGVMTAAWLDQFTGVTRLRRDMWAALLEVYNWVVLAGGDTYSEQISRAAGQRAPLDHYWSLAIEEQFYLVWPLVMLVVLRSSPRGRMIAVAALASLSVVATVVISNGWGADATYFATPARLPEILLGALVAVALHQRRAVETLHKYGADWIAFAGIAVIAWAAVSWPAESGPAYNGWLPAFALASVAVIVGLQIASPLRWVMSLAPLVWLGRISYGVYLYHWPVYTIIDERRLDIGRAPLFAVRAAITLALAGVSYVLIERPIRRRRLASWPTFGVAASMCGLAAVLVAFVPDRGGNFTYVSPETVIAADIPLLPPGEEPPPLTATGRGDRSGIPSGLSRPARVLVIGDSTAFVLGQGMIEWSSTHLDAMNVTSRAAVGCGLSSSGRVPNHSYDDVCGQFRDLQPGVVEMVQPDIVVAMVAIRDLQDRMWSTEEGALPLTDERHRGRLTAAYEELTRDLLDAGAQQVMWVVPPTPDPLAVVPSAWILPDDRYVVYRQVILDVAASFPDDVVVADMQPWMEDHESAPERYDGIHWALDEAVRVTDEYLVPRVFAALVPDLPEPTGATIPE